MCGSTSRGTGFGSGQAAMALAGPCPLDDERGSDKMQRQRAIVLLLGAPGAGKGTQARFISELLGIPHVASGDLLREHRRTGTALGRAAQEYMDRGDLVPDALVIDMIAERLEREDARRGALLDGFPRTVTQAQALEARLADRGDAVGAALYLDVPRAALVDRLAGRWMCGTCQATYHEQFNPPAIENTCNVCEAPLYQRPDDRREVVENRVEVYLRETLPVVEHYQAQGLSHTIDGDRPIDAVRTRLCHALGGTVHGQRRPRWHLFVRHADVGEGGAPSPSLGRTLCGKFVGQPRVRDFGAVDDFEANPCRHCWHALHARQPLPLYVADPRDPVASAL
jgi:adenylate kinase